MSGPDVDLERPSLPAWCDFGADDNSLYTFAAEAGQVRYYTFPDIAARPLLFIRKHLAHPDDDLSDLVGPPPETYSVASTPLRYWQVPGSDVENFSSYATLDIPKSRCRPRRFGDLARKFVGEPVMNAYHGVVTLTYVGSGSGASSQAPNAS